MICKDKADLHEEYARVIRMCKETIVNPLECVKYTGFGKYSVWTFEGDIYKYSFALAIVEDRPVFEGDNGWFGVHNVTVHDRYNLQYVASHLSLPNILVAVSSIAENFTWNPPKKKTFMLNGEELPLPDRMFTNNIIYTVNLSYSWKSAENAMKVEQAINKLLSGE